MPVQVGAVQRRLLGDQDQLLDPLGCKGLCLLYQFLHGDASVMPPDRRNDTVGAAFIAPFRDLEIAVVASCREDALSLRSCPAVLILHQEVSVRSGRSVRVKDLFKDPGDPALGSSAYHGVHFRDLLKHFVLVALGHAARHNESLQFSFRAELSEREDLVDALLLGIHDKAARVDDRGVRFVLIVCKVVPLFFQGAEHFLRIHQVLIAS